MIGWACILLLALPPCSAFHLPCHRHSNSALPLPQNTLPIVFSDVKHLHLAAKRDDGHGDISDKNEDREEFSAAAQDLRLFVTQRCIQSFMFLLASMRDLHTVSWLDSFVQPITINNYWEEDDDLKPGAGDTFRENDKRIGSKLLNYHGLSALNTTMFPTWDSFFTLLLEEPDTILKIATPKELGQRAYSNFDIDIEPARVCLRILSVREQIAREMAGDLKVIANMGQQIFDSYWKNAKDRKDVKQSPGEESSPYGFDRFGAMYINLDQEIDDDVAKPSPIRKGNFDLLYTLITQAAVLHLIKHEDGVVVSENEIQNKASQLFLAKFYQDHLVTHFVGSQWYGKGDDFIEELMLGSPIMMSMKDGNLEDRDEESEKSNIFEVEPLRIAEQILLVRDKLALEWMDIMQAAPSEHSDIRKLQLEHLAGVAEAAPKTIILEDEFQ
mmetsp:Transcript_15290/g.33158  ORF Transcript_15290/g.33158 Transcript_15290/m.33158 type:complete len:442 (+) Transcript_15290:162-1487(+)